MRRGAANHLAAQLRTIMAPNSPSTEGLIKKPQLDPVAPQIQQMLHAEHLVLMPIHRNEGRRFRRGRGNVLGADDADHAGPAPHHSQ
jgi:hypothetical protein